MKIHFSIWACLALFVLNVTNLSAYNTDNSTPNETEKGVEKTKKETKEVIELLPGRNLQLQVNDDKKTLEVNFSGETENLEWVIFQPKGAVISRLSTSVKIDEIKVHNLEPGKYVLMIRDEDKRTLFKAFELN